MKPRRHVCDDCHQPIGNLEAVLVNDKLLHLNHFRCHLCHEIMDATAAFHTLSSSKVACTGCFSKNMAPKCNVCNEGIIDNGVTAAGKTWHSTCLVCNRCRKPLTDTFLLDPLGQPLDHDCFWGVRLQKIVADSFKQTG
uniref:LIM zinc-binding domain-containing protein n=1 Tax=Panagrellus redivivus TaxID=6233 RepID=A0A7E4ZWC2_PANRE